MPIRRAMEIPPVLLQFLGSLAAIAFLAWLARRLGLGGQPALHDADAVRAAAAEAVDGFETNELSIDSEGRAAICRDAGGRIMLLRPHGGHIAARILGPAATVETEGERLIVHCGERTFGSVSLNLRDDERDAWVSRIEAL